MTAEHAGRYSYDFPRPALTVDLVVTTRGPVPQVLLARRRHDPFAGTCSLPGGFVDENGPPEAAARRELVDETGLSAGELRLLGVAGDPRRDPRGWTVSVVDLLQVDPAAVAPQAGDDAAVVAWIPLGDLPELAFDYARILVQARPALANGADGTG